MKQTKTLLFLLTLIVSLMACQSIQKKDMHRIEVVSYIRTWPLGSTQEEIEKNINWKAEDIRGDMIDMLNISFGLLTQNNKIYIPEYNGKDEKKRTFPNLFQEVEKLKKKYPSLKINLSVGGWGADGFSDMAASRENRETFIKDAIDWIKKHNLDGLDIDWEYPVGPDWGLPIKTRPEDAQNFILLLQETREALNLAEKELGRPLGLSIAVPASTWYVEKIDIKEVEKYITYFKIMCYDYYGAWSDTTGHHTNLYNNPSDPAWGGWSTDQAIQLYLEKGIAPEKILMGVAFYGRAWKGVMPENNGLFQPYKEAAFPDGISYTDIEKLEKSGEYTRYWDDLAKAPFLYNGDTWITYDDRESLDYKIKYIEEKGLGGIMVWEYGHDIEERLYSFLHEKAR
ncbi:glycoside hydrolase family 18 protein [Spirochaetia bacterium 38H-sp]|uniref:chitinase n=1 Tax=Rarispira pelagica TaxID=3141764 RepID=A0ABU9U9Q3_9SPIR